MSTWLRYKWIYIFSCTQLLSDTLISQSETYCAKQIIGQNKMLHAVIYIVKIV